MVLYSPSIVYEFVFLGVGLQIGPYTERQVCQRDPCLEDLQQSHNTQSENQREKKTKHSL